jgi:hypothetical protein
MDPMQCRIQTKEQRISDMNLICETKKMKMKNGLRNSDGGKAREPAAKRGSYISKEARCRKPR